MDVKAAIWSIKLRSRLVLSLAYTFFCTKIRMDDPVLAHEHECCPEIRIWLSLTTLCLNSAVQRSQSYKRFLLIGRSRSGTVLLPSCLHVKHWCSNYHVFVHAPSSVTGLVFQNTILATSKTFAAKRSAALFCCTW